jgi:Predicted metal-binding integral membrane protein (DUF2182)
LGAKSLRTLLDRGRWTAVGLAGSLCRALPAGPILLAAMLYVGAWLLMTRRHDGADRVGVASCLKYRCLDKCRAPFSFQNEHWRGADVRQSFKIGVHHGMFSVGCC